MPTWPTIPTWSDPTEINKGNRYNARDGVTAADLNLIITNLMYLKEYGSLSEYSWLGEYVDDVNYRRGAIVRYQGNIYLCTQDLDDQQVPTDTAYWQVLNEVIQEHNKTDFTPMYVTDVAKGELIITYSSTEKAFFAAAPNGAIIETFYDPNFEPGNIRKGFDIFGMMGEYEGEVEQVEEWDGSGVVIEEIATDEPEEPEAPEEPVEDELAGTWLIDDYPTVLSGSFTANVNFTSNGVVYSSITVSEVAVGCNIKYDNTAVLSGGSMVDFPSWTSSAYKTINITTEPTDSTFIEWLKANATKQAETTAVLSIYHNTGDGPTYTFNVPSANGTWYSLDGIVSNESPKISLQIPPSSGDISLLDSTSANGKIAFIRLNNSYIDSSANYNVENYYTYSTWMQAGAGN